MECYKKITNYLFEEFKFLNIFKLGSFVHHHIQNDIHNDSHNYDFVLFRYYLYLYVNDNLDVRFRALQYFKHLLTRSN